MAQVAEAAHATRRESAVPSNSPVSSEPLGPRTLREKAWDRLENDMPLTVFFMATIIVSSVAFILDTYFEDPEMHQVFFMIELVSVVIFTIEYSAKLACAPQPLKFALKFMSLVDLVAIVPFWCALARAAALARSSACAAAARAHTPPCRLAPPARSRARAGLSSRS